MTANLTTYQFALKTLWPQNRIEDLVYQDHPLYAMVKKRTDFVGDSLYVAMQYGDNQARSATFSTAQAASLVAATGSVSGARFLISRVRDYQFAVLDNETIQATGKDEGALVRALDREMKSALRTLTKSLAVSLYRGASGQIGTAASFPSATTLLLNDINSVTNFEPGMVIVAAATLLSGAVSSPASATITAVNRDTGVLTFGTTINTWNANDYLFALGDRNTGGSTGYKVFGVSDWVPTTTPTATTFCGVDRSVDPTRLGGLRIDASSVNPEEMVALVLSRQDREGGKPTQWFVNHYDWRNIANSLGGKVQTTYQQVGKIGFQSIQVMGPRGPCNILADRDCPAGYGYSLDMSTWTLHTLNECPQIVDRDGTQTLRLASSDAFEARVLYYGNFYCDAPGYNAVVTMPA